MKRFQWAPLMVAGLFSAISHADGTDHDKAVASFDEARKMIEDGKCDVAIPKLEESLRYEASVGAHFSMADCYEPRDGLRAWTELREAERLAYIKHDDRTKAAQDRAAALEARLPIVRVTVPPSALTEPGFELRVDDFVVDRYLYLEGVLALKPGTHVVAATAPHKKWSQEVVTQPGTPVLVTVHLENELPPPPPVVVARPTVEIREAGGSQRAAALVLGGLSVGALVAGGAFGIVAMVKKNDIDSACGGVASACGLAPGSQDSRLSEQRTLTHLSTATLVAGGVMLAISVVLFQTSPKARRVEVSANGAGVSLSGDW